MTRAYFRSLEEKGDSPPETPEFPWGAAEHLGDGVSRRTFVKLLGSGTLAGLGGCGRSPKERIYPYARETPGLVPGVAEHYATSSVLSGFATGLVVTSYGGRPIKIEGNPDHPASLGATGPMEQAAILGLYDPHRARFLRGPRGAVSWRALGPKLAHGLGRGERLRLVLPLTTSPLVRSLVERVREKYSACRAIFHAPFLPASTLAATQALYGQALMPQFHVGRAAVIVSLDADFLGEGPFHLRYARHFADRRRVTTASDGMNRLYVAEAALSVTGAMADHRLRVRATDVVHLAAAILAEVLGQAETDMPKALPALLAPWRASFPHPHFARAAAKDLLAHRGESLVVCGPSQSIEVHVLSYLLNLALGNMGKTTYFTASPLPDTGPNPLAPVVSELRAGAVETLLILGGNPVYDAPADLDFGAHLARVPRSLYLGAYENETARACAFFVPAAHELESWGNARAYDGTLSLLQPLVAPLYGGKTCTQVLAMLLGEADASPYELLRQSMSRHSESMETSLQRGLVEGTAAAPQELPPRFDAALRLLESLPAARAPGLELVLRSDSRVHDGQFANNPWLLELPDPITKLTWDNAAVVSPRTARVLGLETHNLVRLDVGGRSLAVPVLVLPGQADDSISLALGYGRGGAEAVARGVGVNAYPLRTSAAPYAATGLRVEKVPGGSNHTLAITQTHFAMHGRPLVLDATLEQFRADPGFPRSQRGPVVSLYQAPPRAGDQWAMSIDLTTCTGCSVCVVACQAENNIPVVGKAGVQKSREMHWLRIDRYFAGSAEEPTVVHQPMACQHCEKAPCEYVCPVNATVHSPDGLNEMIYNRCVGTRFCSNNCPYKVRRFNYFDYTENTPEPTKLAMNPDVTVRARGVMEKCTYCVQRIRTVEITARLEGRSMRDGEVKTACQQACPTQAIVFGSLANSESEVSRARRNPRRYEVLHDLGTRPRTQYLARLRNPNPELV